MVKEGALTKYDVKLKGRLATTAGDNRRQVDVHQTAAPFVRNVGATTLEVPKAARKKRGPQSALARKIRRQRHAAAVPRKNLAAGACLACLVPVVALRATAPAPRFPMKHAFLAFVLLPWVLAAAEQPNIIIINTDDLGYSDIGPFGSNNATPQLDRMAREGRKLMAHYAAPVCTPSRAALLTGSYPKRALPIPGVLFPAAAVGLNPDEVTIAEVLKAAGYVTAAVGKWHLGDQPEFLPTRQGFDSYYGIPYSNDMGTAEEGSKSSAGQKPRRGPAPADKLPKDDYGLRGNNQPPLPLLENETVIERVGAEQQHTLTQRYTERAVQFIHAQASRPFFLYLAHAAVHFPHYPGKKFMGSSPNGLLGDWAQEVDWSVGQILDAVRALQLDRKTLIIFTSDNGGPVNQGATNRPFRGSKNTTWEGGVRVCTIAWWPGKIPPGTSTAAITTMMDVMPTVAKLAGAKMPADRKSDGVDLWPVLAATPNAAAPRDFFHYFSGATLEAVRRGPWKLHIKTGELYQLETDMGEQRDVSAAHPKVVADLLAFADLMKTDLGLDTFGPGCRPVGRVPEGFPLITADGTIRPGFAPGEMRKSR
ncbi:MAG: hypothetical protein RIQ93_1179 [Verrucomicrobiota bacterium]